MVTVVWNFRQNLRNLSSFFFEHFLFISQTLSRKVLLFALKSSIFSENFESFQENAGLVVPWLIGILTFISFEALGLVYANVLKDQIFGVSSQPEWLVVDNFPVEINENPGSARTSQQLFRCNKKFHHFYDFFRQHFDVFGKTELMFFLSRILLNVSIKS